MSSIITLTSDFGLQDHFVSVMKAVILGIHPESRLIDISHQIPAQDVMACAWVLRNSSMHFPPGTVHLVVVDPGVGTKRTPVAIRINDQFFVGPDNGIFSLIADEHEYEAYELNNRNYWKPNPSNTFHGRDIFAPVAAHLASGVPITELGERIDELVTYRWATPIADKDGIQGWVLHIDSFGNLVTNISSEIINEAIGEGSVKIYVGNTILNQMVDTYGDVEDGEPAAYIGSTGMLEIAIAKGNASEMLGVVKGAQISIVLQK